MSGLTQTSNDLHSTMAQLSLNALLPTHTWHYRQDGRTIGPMSHEGLASLVRLGYIKTDAMVWQDGQAEQALSSLPELAAQLTNPFAALPAIIDPAKGTNKAYNGAREIGSSVLPLAMFDQPPSLLLRFGGLMIDSFVIGLMSSALWFVGATAYLTNSTGFINIGFATYAFVSWFSCASLYFSLSEAGRHSSTLGKRLMGLKVVSENKKPMPLLQSLWRGVVKTASIVVLPIAGVVVLSSKGKRALHDILAKTRVVRR